MLNPELFLQILANPDPQMLDQIATQLASQGVPPPPPGSLTQAGQMVAQMAGSPNAMTQMMGNTQVVPPGGPQPAQPTAPTAGIQNLGDILSQSQGPYPDVSQGTAAMVQGTETQAAKKTREEEEQRSLLERLTLAQQALQPKASSQNTLEPSTYFNPPVVGAASLAPPWTPPQALTPQGQTIGTLANYLRG